MQTLLRQTGPSMSPFNAWVMLKGMETLGVRVRQLLSGKRFAQMPPSRTVHVVSNVELLGTEGTMIIDDDHLDHLLYSEKGVPHAYVPDHGVKMAFLGSNTAGDWAVGDFWGPLANETRGPRFVRCSRRSNAVI